MKVEHKKYPVFICPDEAFGICDAFDPQMMLLVPGWPVPQPTAF